MARSSKLWVGALALGLLAFAFAIPALLVTLYTVARFQMSYNEQGNYFDGTVVHHAGHEYVYGLIALLFWAFAAFAAVGAYRAFKCTKAH